MKRVGKMKELEELMIRYPRLECCRDSMLAAFRLLDDCYARDSVVYVCGNGGSAADAEHIVGELMKSFTGHRPLPADFTERTE